MEYMCKAFEGARNEKAIWIAQRMIAGGKLSLEEIADYTGLPIQKIRELAGAKTA